MKDNSCIAVQCAIVQTCNHSIWVLKPIRMTSLCTAGITAHARERNPHPRRQKSPYQLQHEDILYRQSHWTALKKTKPKKKNKCQESFCCCLQQNVPGCDAIIRLCRDMSGFLPVISAGELHPYLSSIYVSTAAGTQPAGLMMSRGTDGFCCHLEWWLPALSLSLNQGWQTDTQTGWQTFT